MFHRQFGAVNAHPRAARGASRCRWFSHFSTAFAANVATNVWLGFPFMMVVVARRAHVDPEGRARGRRGRRRDALAALPARDAAAPPADAAAGGRPRRGLDVQHVQRRLPRLGRRAGRDDRHPRQRGLPLGVHARRAVRLRRGLRRPHLRAPRGQRARCFGAGGGAAARARRAHEARALESVLVHALLVAATRLRALPALWVVALALSPGGPRARRRARFPLAGAPVARQLPHSSSGVGDRERAVALRAPARATRSSSRSRRRPRPWRSRRPPPTRSRGFRSSGRRAGMRGAPRDADVPGRRERGAALPAARRAAPPRLARGPRPRLRVDGGARSPSSSCAARSWPIPVDLEEAAMVDGATRAQAFWHVVLPAARPAIAVTALFAFMSAWNEFILAATLLSRETRVHAAGRAPALRRRARHGVGAVRRGRDPRERPGDGALLRRPAPARRGADGGRGEGVRNRTSSATDHRCTIERVCYLLIRHEKANPCGRARGLASRFDGFRVR